MTRFRRKVTEVEAEQFLPRMAKGAIYGPDGWYVITIHSQRVYLTPGDWIIPEPDGVHFYPVKPAVFEATYEPIEVPAPTEPALLLELAWGLVANASGGDWNRESVEWNAAAVRWREQYFEWFRAREAASTVKKA